MCLNTFYNIKERFPTVKKRTLLVLHYVGTILFQTRAKIQKLIKGFLNCCKLLVVVKSQNRWFKYILLQRLCYQILYVWFCFANSIVDFAMTPIIDYARHVAARIEGFIRISVLMNKTVQLKIDIDVCLFY